MKKTIIEFDHVTKDFDMERDKLLKKKISEMFLGKKNSRFKAINNVSFKIKEGESVGLWGSNGSGKSSVLKLICGLYQPDNGRVTVKGQVASVLELGVGLHPDLTGRDNVFFYSSILSIPKEEVEKNYSKIVEFFGFGNFIDIPVKRYSSGMKSRLAFSIAAFSRAPILLFDEVLAVGDMDFKERAMEKINQLRKERTIVFTSHSYTVVQQLCDRMISFENGKICGSSGSVGVDFLRSLDNGIEVKVKAMSNSMMPVIEKGDLVRIKKIPYEKLVVGDVVAFLFPNLEQMIVHRIVAKKETLDGKVKCFTKGDFSYETDPWFMTKDDYLGKVVEIKKPFLR